jgi:stress response protein SCP2
MTKVMPKGSNTPLTSVDALRAVLRWRVAPGSPDIDAVALLLGSAGRVRSDADFIFYNQPRHPSGWVRHRSKSRLGDELTDTLDIDLVQLPTNVERVVVGGSAEGGTFGQIAGLCILLYDIARGPDAEPVARFDIADAGGVTALLFGEIYRRSGAWKFRAIGQGYSSGLVGLAKDFGVTVDDEDEEDSESTRTAAAPEQAPAPAPDATAAPVTAPATAPATAPSAPPVPPLPVFPPLLPVPEGFALPPQGPQFLSAR